MRRFLKLIGGLGLVLVLGTGVASAQLNEPLLANLDFLPGITNTAPSPFTCLDGTECKIFQRMYPDLDPTLLNDSSVAITTTNNDGHPTFDVATSQWRGDDFFSGNYSGVSANADACEA